ncbi:efflux RND transporter periplasmic adaptor subunit [Anaerotignum sp.]
MKKHVLVALALCMALGTACGKEEVVEEKQLRSVEITTVGKSQISSEFAYTGKAAPSKEVDVVPTVPGKVTSFNYEVGDKVSQGAVLFTVDSVDLQNNLRSLEANYKAGKLGRDNAKNTYDNNKLLYEEEIISQQDFDQIKYAYESAEAQLETLQVQIDNMKKNISDCTVTSPMTGVIATRGVEKGGYASQASTAYTVMDLSTIKVEVGVSEQVLNNIHIGDKVSVLMTAVSPEPLVGTVSTIAPATGQSGMYTVKVELNNKDGKIKSGMMAEVNFTMASAEDTIVLPRNAVIEKDGETYVYVIKNNVAKKVNVELGIEAEDTIEITSGLKKGDDVVTKGQTYISDGEEVSVSNAAPAKTTTETNKSETETKEKGE